MIEEKVKIIPMTYDKMFKSVLTSKEARGYLVEIISDITGLPKNKIEKDRIIKNSEHSINSISEKKKISDLVVEIKDSVINLEMNKYYYDGLIDRNHEYIAKIRESLVKEGETYSELKKIIQINFDNYNKYKPDDRVVIKFEMRDKEKGVEEGVGIESYHVILPNVKEKYYNEDNKDELVGKLVIMVEERYEELEKLIEKYIELRPVGKKMVEISRDEELQGIYDAEEHARKVRNSIMATELKKNFFEGLNKGMKKGIKEGIKEGRKEGREEGIKEGREEVINSTASKMLKKDMEVDLISELTGLSIDEIIKLKESN